MAVRRRNMLTAAGSAVVGVAAFAAERLQPVDSIRLLHEMDASSPKLEDALANGRPTIVDFYADWCENCKVMAPKLKAIEREYGGRVNFVALDGDSRVNDRWVSRFQVDGIPHFAFVNADGEVLTALIGNIPTAVMKDDLDALISRKELPYLGYDAFQGRSRRVKVD
eukprot:FR741635.1.p1 GENE.FR741635.1~~FR741635.1.p1  ORF type:complete len:167 (+),score=9.25 FR741635.1:1-501(+)